VANDDRLYIETVLKLYLSLPETPSRTSRYDRELATQLCERKIPMETIEAAFLLASARLSIAKSPNLQKTLDFPAGSQYSRRGNEWFNCLHLGVLLRLQSAS
jgi:hypothetical protein